MNRKLTAIFILLSVLLIIAGCSSPQEEAVPEVVWDTLTPEEQSIEVTVTDIAREHMEADWDQKSSDSSLFMLIPGSS